MEVILIIDLVVYSIKKEFTEMLKYGTIFKNSDKIDPSNFELVSLEL